MAPTSPSAQASSSTWRDLPAGTSRKATAAALLLAALSGTLIFLACADFNIWPLAYVAMVPCLWLVDRAPTRRRALLYAWVAGIVANAGGFYWISGLLTRFASFPLPLAVLGLLLLSAYQSVVFLLFALAVRAIRRFSAERLAVALPMVLVAPVAMVCFEMLVPFLFPWYLAITQAWVIPIIQIAELTGPVGVTAVLLATSGAIYDLLTAPGLRRRLACAAGAALLLAATLGFGFWRMGQVDARRQDAPKLRVGVVQGNVPFDEKGLLSPKLAERQLRDLQQKSAELEAQGAQLLLWTESAYPYYLGRHATEDFPAHTPFRIRRGFTAPLVLGAVTQDIHDRDAYPYNSALLQTPDGRFVGRFDKMYLLLFGEYIPGLETFPFLRDIVPKAAGHFARGQEIVTFPLDVDGTTYRLGPMICYEDILPAFGRTLSEMRPHLFVNLTNDAWFGDTSEPWEHLALSVFRSVEHRTDMVRAVNTGVSAFIDANGRVHTKTYAVDPAIDPRGVDGVVAEVALMEAGHTFYARFGDVFGHACVAATAFLWLLWPWWARRRSQTAR